MLMKPEDARKLQIDVQQWEEAKELEMICSIIQRNLEVGKSTLIYKSDISSKDTITAIEKMGYTVIDSIWYDPSRYLITVNEKQIKEIKQYIFIKHLVPVLAMVGSAIEVYTQTDSGLGFPVDVFLSNWFRNAMILYVVSMFVKKQPK